MGFFKRKKKVEEFPELYTSDEIREVETLIDENFGKVDSVFHEIVSPDIHVDIAMIAPTEERPYYILSTMGMGAHRMNVPSELDEYRLHYAELIVYLPKEWDIQSSDENSYWPIRWLKSLARLPIDCDTWLGYGHTIAVGENHETLSSNNRFEGIGLIDATTKDNKIAMFKMKNQKVLHFYQMIPLYGDEMEYKLATEDIASIMDKFDEQKISYIVDINRKKVV